MTFLDIRFGRWTESGSQRRPVLILKTEQDSIGFSVISAAGSNPKLTDETIHQVLKAAGLSDDLAVVWLYRQAVDAVTQGRFASRSLTEQELYEACAERVHL